MRKDIFIVGARLLGIWQLLGALNSLAYMVSYWSGPTRPPSYTQEYNVLTFIIHLITGLYLLFRTHRLYDVLVRLVPEEKSVEDGELNDGKPE